MELSKIEKSIYEIVRSIHNEKVITNDMNLEDDLCFDSLDLVDAVVLTERQFGIDIADDVWIKCKTVQDIVNIVNNIINK